MHSSALGNLQRFVEHAVKLLPRAIAHYIAEFPRTPIVLSVGISLLDLLKVRLHRLNVLLFVYTLLHVNC